MNAHATVETMRAPGAGQDSVRIPPLGRRYLIVTPCRDEAEYIRTTLETVAAQTIQPALWIVVDDGSTDGTSEILDAYAEKLPFLRVIHRNDRGRRSVGPGVVDAFYAGLSTVNVRDFDFVCKLDGDVELPPSYFQRMMEAMEAEPRLGNVSGTVFVRDARGRLVHEKRGSENAAGPAKFYRVSCFEEIGGFVRHVGWDSVDGHTCRLKGWIAQSIDTNDTALVHLRQMGSSDRGVLLGRIRGGRDKWFIGRSLPYVLITAVYRMTVPPYVIGAALMVWGYLLAMIRREPRYGDAEYRRFLRRYEWESMLLGKRRATQRRHDAIRRRYATELVRENRTGA